MPRFSRPLRSGLLLLLLALGAASPAAAALTRQIRVTGTSSAPGVCSITIESFGLLRDSRRTESPFVVNVPIPVSSSPSATVTLIRNDVDAALPGDYVVTELLGQIVRIHRTTGTFTLSVAEDVPGQTIAETPVGVPLHGAGGLTALGALLSAAGALFLRSRRR